ncbi:hypothetical protein ACQK5W_04075 [Pantoea sp. FN060301]|uniref:hypothetical protein n=1 Tax=Pantoea sp. FN060301 TaxID=3420380 RepID=UPI003D17AD88
MSKFMGMPGPWIASKTDRSIGPVSKDDDQSYGMINPVAWVEFDGNPDFQAANANLIAAAPELLEALQAVVRVADRATDEFDMARAAINKALGQ